MTPAERVLDTRPVTPRDETRRPTQDRVVLIWDEDVVPELGTDSGPSASPAARPGRKSEPLQEWRGNPLKLSVITQDGLGVAERRQKHAQIGKHGISHDGTAVLGVVLGVHCPHLCRHFSPGDGLAGYRGMCPARPCTPRVGCTLALVKSMTICTRLQGR